MKNSVGIFFFQISALKVFLVIEHRSDPRKRNRPDKKGDINILIWNVLASSFPKHAGDLEHTCSHFIHFIQNCFNSFFIPRIRYYHSVTKGTRKYSAKSMFSRDCSCNLLNFMRNICQNSRNSVQKCLQQQVRNKLYHSFPTLLYSCIIFCLFFSMENGGGALFWEFIEKYCIMKWGQ